MNMVCLEDKIKIDAPREEIINWLRRLPRNYRQWHPKDHREFKVITGELELKEGSVAHAVEYLGKFLLSFKFKIIRVESDREIYWRAMFPFALANLNGRFLLEERDNATEVTASICYGWPIPFLGNLLDWFLEQLFADQKAILKHMREENEYLKAAIESQNKNFV